MKPSCKPNHIKIKLSVIQSDQIASTALSHNGWSTQGIPKIYNTTGKLQPSSDIRILFMNFSYKIG